MLFHVVYNTDSMPSSCGMFVYSDVTSAVTKKRCQVEVGVFKELWKVFAVSDV